MLESTEDKFATISVTEPGRDLLVKRETVILTRPMAAPSKDEAGVGTKRRRSGVGAIDCDEGLFSALRKLRAELANARGVPPYVIFSDTTLRQMARTYPRDEVSLLQVPGVGERKLSDFGQVFLGAIGGWLRTNSPRQFS